MIDFRPALPTHFSIPLVAGAVVFTPADSAYALRIPSYNLKVCRLVGVWVPVLAVSMARPTVAVPDHILGVLLTCSPRQIFKTVIRLDVVQVSALLSPLWHPVPGHQDKAVNRVSGLQESHHRVPGLTKVRLYSEGSATPARGVDDGVLPDGASVGDAVGATVAGNRSVSFHKKHYSRIGYSHG